MLVCGFKLQTKCASDFFALKAGDYLKNWMTKSFDVSLKGWNRIAFIKFPTFSN